MSTPERRLVSAERFKALVRRGATPDDLQDLAVFKASAGKPKAIDETARTVEFVLSNDHEDREGDTLALKGWRLADYEKNGVVLFAHLHQELPIGKSLRVWMTDADLRSLDEFASPELYPFADTVFRMVQGGFLNAVSVGFQPDEYVLAKERDGIDFLTQALLEHSVVPVPAHPEALVVARSKGIDTLPMKEWAERMLDRLTAKGADPMRGDLERLRAQADPTGRKLIAALGLVKLPAGTVTDRGLLARPADFPADTQPKALHVDALRAAAERAVTAHEKLAVAAMDPAVADAAIAVDAIIGQLADASDTLLAALGVADAPDAPETLAAGMVEIKLDPGAARTALALPEAGMGHQMLGMVLSGGAALPDVLVVNAERAHVPAEYAGQTVVAIAHDPSGTRTADEIETKALATRSELAREPETLVVLGAGDVAEPRRWNRALSKAFDVAREQFPPRNAEQALVAKYVDCDVKDLYLLQWRVPSARMGSFLSGLDQVLSGCKVDDTRNLTAEGKEEPPTYEQIQLNSRASQDFLVDGLRFFKRVVDAPPPVKFGLRVAPSWSGLEVTAYGKADARDAVLALRAELTEKMHALNFLKGEAFALAGDFLPRGSESFDDLFLAPKNQRAAERILALVNDKGADLDNRGVLLVGPPGTGKTLFGRVLLNKAQATFIWISSRDFAYCGGFGGLTEAFDLARECAPTVLFIEDVDNWMNGYTTDLLKTEMDGIAQSKGVVTILTTNYPELLPAALIDRPGRFHDVLRFDLPDSDCRLKMLQRWMPELDAADAAKAVAATAGMSGAHVRELSRFAGIIAEQEQVGLSAAIDAAIAKLKEQRDLVTAVQATGSRYRAPEFVTGLRVTLDGKALAEAMVGKAGRVLAQRNERRLKEAQGHCMKAVNELGDTEDQCLQQAVTKIGHVLDEVAADAAGPTDGTVAPESPVSPLALESPARKHVLVLDPPVGQREVGDVDLAALNAAIRSRVADIVMRRTGHLVE